MESKDQLDLTRMNRAVFEALEPAQLVELTCRLHTMAMELSERLALNSTNSSLVRSALWRRGRCDGQRGRPQGRWSQRRCHAAGREGAAAVWPQARQAARRQGHVAGRAAEDGTYREPLACVHCGIAFEMWDVGTAEAFAVLELERT